ncbi:MAG: TIGR03619 family F420-dependent LLM class oxidoreductase [Candidatus Marsarchaeota archaeon]|nr:TIGR03619 family F420-dependent LLM class oxidoreductase [Candidatus Marsarchaeota archaeon]
MSNYGETSSAEEIREMAVEVEDLGYHSIWATDHILMPAPSGTPYERIFDSLSTLAYLSGVTSKLRLGVSSLVIALRNPVEVTKQLATIDNFSGGRVMLAVAAGWNQSEFQNLGAPFRNRGRVVDESVALMESLWESGGRANFEGKVLPYKFNGAAFEPSPVQKKLTIWIAGNSAAAIRRAVKLGDGWHPNVYPLDEFRLMVAKFREASAGAHKDLCVRIGLNTESRVNEYVSPQGERRVVLCGNMEANADIVDALDQLGTNYMVLAPNPSGKTPFKTQLEGLRLFAKRFL